MSAYISDIVIIYCYYYILYIVIMIQS